jgi:hypothetical protein
MKQILYIFLTTSMLLFTACEDSVLKIGWETKNIPQKLIVEGNVTTESSKHPIVLRYTGDYFANEPAKMVTNAQVSINAGANVIYYNENPDNPGVYEAENEFTGELNTSYELNILLEEPVDGTNKYSATTELVEGMLIDSVTAGLYNNPIMNNEDDSLILISFFYGLEPAGNTNYYLLKLFRNGEIISDTINDYGHFSDSEYGINGETVFGFFINEEYEPGDTFGFELYSIPKAYDIFLDGVNQISQPADPFGFSGPPANAVGNINNGKGLGFFYGAHVTSASTIVRDNTNL